MLNLNLDLSLLHSLRPCWTAFLSILRLCCHRRNLLDSNSILCVNRVFRSLLDRYTESRGLRLCFRHPIRKLPPPFHTYVVELEMVLIQIPDWLTIVSNLEACYLCIDSALVGVSPFPGGEQPCGYCPYPISTTVLYGTRILFDT
jgi:hypothetical protein